MELNFSLDSYDITFSRGTKCWQADERGKCFKIFYFQVQRDEVEGGVCMCVYVLNGCLDIVNYCSWWVLISVSFIDLARFLILWFSYERKSGHLQRKLQSCLWPQSGKKPGRHGCTQEFVNLCKEEAQRDILLNKKRQSLGWQGQQLST